MAKAAAKAKTTAKVKAKAPRAVKRAVKAVPRPMMSVAQRDRVMKAAIHILEREGYEAFSIRSVAAKSRVDLKLLKASYPSQLHLLATVLETSVEEDTDAAQTEILSEIDFRSNNVDGVARMIQGQLMRHAKGGWLRLFLNLDIAKAEPDHADMWRIIESRLSDRASRIVEEMQWRSYIDAELDPYWVQFFWSALMDGLSVRSRALPDADSIKAVAEGLAPILVRGFAPKGG